MATVFDINFSELSLARLLEIIRQKISERSPCYIVTPNLHHARLAHKNARFRDVIESADLRLCDSAILSGLLALKGQALPARLTGSDLTPRLLEIAEAEQLKVYLFGSDMPTLEKVGKRFPRAVCGMASPPYHERPWDLDELNESFLQDMKKVEPDILFIALGPLKQEYWARKYFVESGIPVTLCVGASLDYVAGRVKRSPKLFSKIGLEWLWRVVSEPRRLWRRYYGDGVFLLQRGLFELFRGSSKA